MINVENEIFNRVASAVRKVYPGIYITGEYVKSPPNFPCCSLIEMSNIAYGTTQSSGSLENHAKLMYELNVYSNKSKGKKSECKDIAEVFDTELSKLGFTRVMLQPIQNMDDATIYRIVGRYEAVVSKDSIIYRR